MWLATGSRNQLDARESLGVALQAVIFQARGISAADAKEISSRGRRELVFVSGVSTAGEKRTNAPRDFIRVTKPARCLIEPKSQQSSSVHVSGGAIYQQTRSIGSRFGQRLPSDERVSRNRPRGSI